MSDTTAFLAGCAITGVAAVLMMGGGLAIGQYQASDPAQPSSTVAPVLPVIPPPAPAPSSSQAVDDQYRQDQYRLKAEVDQQQTEIEGLKSRVEDLKSQLEKQQTESQRLTSQLQQQQTQIETMVIQRSQLASSIEQPNRYQTLTLGAVGVMLLIVTMGGGMILVGIIVLLVQSQRRQARSMQVIHPIQSPYTFSTQDFLPSAAKPRRTRQIEYYED
jgi:membrane-bound ClpP family serine protease